MTPRPTPANPGEGDAGDGCTGTVISINGTDYGFPLALPKSDVNNGYSWPCPSICHHDGTPAFDLARRPPGRQLGRDVSGRHHQRQDPELQQLLRRHRGCQSFQLVGDDGWWYWYGHVQQTSVQDGQTVTAGQPIAVIGERACTGNGSYPHLHIDRGSPRVTPVATTAAATTGSWT